MTNSSAIGPRASDLPALLRGELESVNRWAGRPEVRQMALWIGVIVLGAGCYGAAMGAWRSPLQALFVGIKFPLILLLTAAGNGLLNSMLAPMLGLNIGPRQSLSAILMSFAIASAILGALSPLTAFLVWNAPPLAGPRPGTAYSLIKLTHVAAIAFAGLAANIRLAAWLRQLGSPAAARRVLLAWLAGNLLLGSQLSWNLRPFIGAPDLPVQFLRATAFRGNFFENVLNSFLSALTAQP